MPLVEKGRSHAGVSFLTKFVGHAGHGASGPGIDCTGATRRGGEFLDAAPRGTLSRDVARTIPNQPPGRSCADGCHGETAECVGYFGMTTSMQVPFEH